MIGQFSVQNFLYGTRCQRSFPWRQLTSSRQKKFLISSFIIACLGFPYLTRTNQNFQGPLNCLVFSIGTVKYGCPVTASIYAPGADKFTYGGRGGKTLGVRELRDRDPKRFEWLAFYMYTPFKWRPWIATVLTKNDNYVKMKFYEIKIWTKMTLTAFTIWVVNSLVSSASRSSYTALYCLGNVKRTSTVFTSCSGK